MSSRGAAFREFTFGGSELRQVGEYGLRANAVEHKSDGMANAPYRVTVFEQFVWVPSESHSVSGVKIKVVTRQLSSLYRLFCMRTFFMQQN